MSRNYSNTAVETTLSSGVTGVATTVPVSSTTGFPTAPFILALDADAATQELVLVTAVAGLNLTATRGYDNTTAQAHSAGAVVRHSHAAIDFRESRTHEAATVAHGATGAVVGTTNTQTLSGKTIALGSNTVSGTTAQFNTALTDGDFATRAGTETLTNKTVAVSTNSISGWLPPGGSPVFAIADAVSGTLDPAISREVPNGVVVGTTDTQTLTNKTLTNPTITATTGWTAFTPTLDIWGTGNGTLTGSYHQIGKTVHFSVKFTAGSTSTFVGAPQFGIPFNLAPGAFSRPVGQALLADSSSSARAVRTAVSSGVDDFVNLRAEDGSLLNSTTPWAWATGDTIEITGTYEAA